MGMILTIQMILAFLKIGSGKREREKVQEKQEKNLTKNQMMTVTMKFLTFLKRRRGERKREKVQEKKERNLTKTLTMEILTVLTILMVQIISKISWKGLSAPSARLVLANSTRTVWADST